MASNKKLAQRDGLVLPTVHAHPMHGYAYQMNLGIVILLHAYKKHTTNSAISFELTIEDRVGGKFDDLVYRRCVSGSGKDILYVQVKHTFLPGINDAHESPPKRSKTNISIDSLVKHQQSKYHLGKYFSSFLEQSNQQRRENETDSYALCTNLTVDQTLASHLEALPNTNVLSFADDIHAVCYRINPSSPISRLLKDLSIDLLGKFLSKRMFLTEQCYQKEFGRGEPDAHVLFDTYASLINQAFDLLDQDSACNAPVRRCKFTTHYHSANGATEMSKLKAALDKYLREPLAYSEEFLIAKCLARPPGPRVAEHDIMSKVEQFCERFVLITDASLQNLRQIVKNHIPRGLDTEQTLTKLQDVMFSAINNPFRVPVLMDPAFVKNTFQDLLCQKQFILHMSSTNKYISKLHTKHPYSAIEPARLKSLYDRVRNDLNGGISTFSSYYDLDLSAVIVSQMLDVAKTEYLSINSAQYRQGTEMAEHVNLVLSRHKCAKQHALLAVGKLEQHEYESLKLLAETHRWNIIQIVQCSSEGLPEQQMGDRLRVGDLTAEEQEKMRTNCKDLSVFGTHVPFDTIVNRTDDLSLLMPLLNAAKVSENLNKQSFEKVREWYIHRDFVPFEDATELLEAVCKSAKIIESLRKCYADRKASFEELMRKFDALDTDDQRAVGSICKSETSDPPGLSCQSKVHILIDDAGFGKTTYFTWLAWRLTVKQPSLYVVKLNALEYSTDFERLDTHKIEKYDNTQVIRLLYHFIYLAHFVSNVNRQTVAETDLIRRVGDHCAGLLSLSDEGLVMLEDDPSNVRGTVTATQLIGLRLFRDKLNEQQFVLLLDGFDEVAPYYKEAVLACLKRFSDLQQMKSVYISSRPYDFEKDFRRTFSACRMYRLKPFSRQDQMESLRKFLTRELQDVYSVCEANHRQLVLRILDAILDDALDDVKTVPLLLDMAFGKMLPAIKRHIDFRSNTVCGTIFITEKFDALQLVEFFVERKLAIAHADKAGTTDSAAKTAASKQNNRHVNNAIQELHAVLAMYVMFASQCRNKLLTKREKNMATQYLENVCDMNTGLIASVRDGIPLFTHRIFAEYFAACWLHAHEDRLRRETFFRSKSFWTYGLKRMRAFFDQMIIRDGGGSDIHMAVLNDATEQVLMLLANDPDLAHRKDADDRTPLHLAVRKLCNHSDIRNAILERVTLEDINVKDLLFGWTALDYSFVTGNDNAIRQLLQVGANINVDTFIDQLCSNKLDVMLKQVYHYCEIIGEWESHVQEVATIYERTVRHLIKDRRLDIHACEEKLGSISVLDYCAKYRMYDLFRQFVEQTGSPREVLAGVADRLLQLAFSTHAHEITNYLIDECYFPIPWIKCSRSLVHAAKGLISLNAVESFKKVLSQLCVQRNISCTNDADIITEHTMASGGANDLHLAPDDRPKVCCVHNGTNVDLPVQEYDGYEYVNDACVFELLLTTAVHEGNLQLASYIVQKKQMTIDNSLIVAVMRLLPKIRGVRHERSIPCFNYLLDKTNNLYSTDWKGRNLLQMAIQNGCFYIVHCLVAKGFDRTLINSANEWNTFHYVAGTVFERTDRPIKTFNFLNHRSLKHLLHKPNLTGYKPFELAVLNNHFKLAQTMFEEMWEDTTTEEQRLSQLLHSIGQMIDRGYVEAIIEFQKFVSHGRGQLWEDMCSVNLHDIPVV